MDLIIRFLAVCMAVMFACSVQAATPSTKSFRGTGGIMVTSNDVTAVITIDGSGVVATGTNSTIRISTNGVLLTAATQANFGLLITGVVNGATVSLGVDANQITNAIIAFAQAQSMVLSNEVGTVGKNVTNVVSLSTSNATSKPITNAYSNGTLTLFGNGLGSGLTLTINSNIIYGVDWAQVASQTNLTVISNLVYTVITNQAATNLYVTNECYVSTGLNTNILLITAAGSAAANGTYNWNGSTKFTNGQADLYFEPSQGLWVITNGATGILYDALDAIGPWDDVVGGIAPAPSGAYGPITNCFASLVAVIPLGLPKVSTNIFVSASLGNDTNAVKGRIDRQYKTIDGAIGAAVDGDTIYFDAGDYPFTVNAIATTTNVKLIGAGRGITRLGTAGGPEQRLRPKSGSIIRNLTFYGAIDYGNGAPDTFSAPVTNCIIENCDIIGDSDAVEADVFQSIRIVDSFLYSAFDGLAEWDLRPGGSNRVITLVNTVIVVTNNNFGTCHGISMGDSRIEMYGGSIEVRDGSTDNNCVYASVDSVRTNKSGSVLLSNVRLRSISTNNNAPFVTNFNNLPIFLDNCTMERVTPMTSTMPNNNYTNQWSDRFIAFTNTIQATNWLVDTRSLTNSLCSASEQGFTITICDAGFNAATSNLWIATRANQKILASGLTTGPTITNITANGGCMTLRIVGTNWMIGQPYAPATATGGSDSTNHVVEAFGDITVTNTIDQIGGGTGLRVSGAIKSSGLALNIVDSNAVPRITIAALGDTTFNSTNNRVAMIIDKDGNVVITNSLTLSNVTASRVAVFDAGKKLTNGATSNALLDNFFAMGVSNIVAGTGIVLATNNGTLWITNRVGLQQLTNTSFVNLSSGDILEFSQLDNLWHNFPPFYQIYYNITVVSNVFIGVGTNIEQSLAIIATNSFGLTYGGTPMPGERFHVAVFNSNATVNINMTNNSYNPQVASNVLYYTIASNSIASFTFINRTNWNTAGTNRWELDVVLQKEVELAVAGQSLATITNFGSSTITISNAYNGAGQTVSGAGNGSTNYLLTISTNSINYFYLGSSNVNIYTVGGGGLGYPVFWNANVTNLSANNWGISFASGTNRWLFSGTYGTNAPTVLTNNTRLFLSGVSDSTNEVVGYTFYSPAQ